MVASNWAIGAVASPAEQAFPPGRDAASGRRRSLLTRSEYAWHDAVPTLALTSAKGRNKRSLRKSRIAPSSEGEGTLITIGESLKSWAVKAPDALCLADASNRLTYAQVNTRVNQAAAALLDLGVRPGDAIAVCARNSIEYMELLHAASKLNVRIVTLNFWLRAAELRRLATHSDARWLFVDAATLPIVADDLKGDELDGLKVLTLHDVPGSDLPDFTGLAASGDSAEPDVRPNPDAPFWMMYTSGTTGNAKGVVRSQYRTSACTLYGVVEFGFHREDRFLALSPFFHGVTFYALMCLMAGGAVFIRPSFDAGDVLDAIRDDELTCSFMVPTMLGMLNERFEQTGATRGRVRMLLTGGAPMSTSLKERTLANFGPVLYEFYGSTESGYITALHPRDQRRKERCCGQPAFGSEVEIRDQHGRALPAGEVGEVFTKCAGRFDEYYKDPERTAQALHGEWFTAGDLGRVDEEGYVYIVDRKTDMIISGGENIYPSEIEDCLHGHPEIRDCAVIGVPDDLWGESVQAWIVPAHPGRHPSPEDLRAYCAQRIAGFKCPKTFVFTDELPRNASGKILKTDLRRISQKKD
ncbi:class I adenylate-forming enzyme family protein [Microbispora sp. CA-102843]|uniref:class I adenylate-forming enzyme family protein n=1 Tax=Microbispora sp. CA-102843 TaxID=3239952 RepID=UPI003D8D482D